MKRKIISLVAVALLLTVAGCNKQKTCSCSVRGTSDVRIVKIERGECEQVKLYQYHTALDSLEVDSLVCTGYEFGIDSIFKD